MASYREFLKKALTAYKNPDITQREVEEACTTFTDLRPKLDDHYFNDGTKKNLLKMEGTIPVSYKGSIYNIPICIWLMDTHPYNPPLVYLKPTENMQIRVGRNVDQDGKIDSPYLREWRYSISDLTGLIQILLIEFGEEPPLYKRTYHRQENENTPHLNLQSLRKAKYTHPEITIRDVKAVLENFTDLKPVMESFAYEKGVVKCLLELRGVIPVKYGETLFMVPIGIVVLDSYPYSPPLAYVRPSSNALINVGKNIDRDGKVNLTYLKTWKHPHSDLFGLVKVMTIVFGEEPPTRPRFLNSEVRQTQSNPIILNTSSRHEFASANMASVESEPLHKGSNYQFLSSFDALGIGNEDGNGGNSYKELHDNAVPDSLTDDNTFDQTGVKYPFIQDDDDYREETIVKSRFVREEPRMLRLDEKIDVKANDRSDESWVLLDDDETVLKSPFMEDAPQMLQLDEKIDFKTPSQVDSTLKQDMGTNVKLTAISHNSLNEGTEVKLPFSGADTGNPNVTLPKTHNLDNKEPVSSYRQILNTALRNYKFPDETETELLAVFTSFSDLRPAVDDYVSNDGVIHTLLQLNGTIPACYKGSIYNIPICIWLMDTHPYNPPLVYVKPTENMQIKVGRNVDQDGKIDLPYLREWKNPRSDLLTMIQILTIVFGEETPVYAKN